MNRIKWLAAEWPAAMRTIGAKLKTISFVEDSLDGFFVERIRDDYVQGRYIEKFAYREVITDPFGNETVVDRTAYSSTDFTLFAHFPHIELLNPQRNTKGLVNRLLEVCNFKLVVSPIEADLLRWVATAQRALSQKVRVDSLQVSDVELQDGVSAKMLLKGDRDVRAAVDDIVCGRRYTLDKVQMKLNAAGKSVTVHIARNGTAKIPPDNTSELRVVLRASLPR